MDESRLRQELVYLRKGSGATPSKLRRCPELLSHPALISEAAQGPENAWNAARELLNDTLNAIGDHRSNALRNAWRLSEHAKGNNLTERRQSFAAMRNRDSETIEVWENGALDDVLLTLAQASPDPVGTRVPVGTAPVADISQRVPSPGLQVDACDVRLTIDRAGLRSVEQRLTVRALRRGVTTFRRGIWTGGNAVETKDIGALVNCTLEEIVPLPNNGQQLILKFSEELLPGRPFLFSWQRRYGVPELKPYWSYTPQVGTVDFRLIATFVSSTPKLLWRFDNLHTRAVPGLPDEDNTLAVGDAGVVGASFAAMAGSESGIGWEWPSS